MSKERLEEIKHFVDLIKYIPRDDRGMGEMDVINVQEDMKWLIEQAERVQGLENDNRVLKKVNVGSERAKERLRNWIDELEIENERYREALEEIRALYPLRNLGYQVSEIRKIVIKALEVRK